MAVLPTLVVMAKAPRLGRVKTRLSRAVGPVEAWRVYRAICAGAIRRLSADRRWRTVLAVTPDHAVDDAFWPEGLARIGQGAGDLGARMQRVFDRFAPAPTLIVGSDIPALSPGRAAAAFCALTGADIVLGPAADGGYWLVGAKGRPRAPRLFENVRWSSPHALEDTLANARGLKPALLATLEDVDDFASYRRWLRCGREGAG